MKKSKIYSERRRHERVQPTESTLVIGSTIFGQVLDLSIGGLSYAASDEQNSTETELDVGILLGDSGTYIGEFQAEGISDFSLNTEVVRQMRRRGLSFSTLSSEQRKQLEELVQRFLSESD